MKKICAIISENFVGIRKAINAAAVNIIKAMRRKIPLIRTFLISDLIDIYTKGSPVPRNIDNETAYIIIAMGPNSILNS